MKFCRIFLPLLFAVCVFSSTVGWSQEPKARLRSGIREGSRAVLPGSRPPRVLRAQDLGPVRANQAVHGMTLVFRRSDAQEAELQRLLAAQQNPGSPEFHRWLTPGSFGQRFGMADSDLETATQWLSAQGFAVSGVSRARDRITFSGTAAQVATAFSAPLHRFEVEGEVHFAPSVDVSLPADLAAATMAVLHLSDFRPRPSAHPAFTASADQGHFLTPGDLAVMYNLPRAYDPNFAPGTGQTIAIVGQSYVDVSGSSRFRGENVATEPQSISLVLVPNTGVEAISPGDAAESEIDLEYVGGLVPAANLLLVHVGDDRNYNVFDALAFAIDGNIAPVVNISYGACETLLSAAELEQGNALFQQAAAQGQTLIASSGDTGSSGCVYFPTSSVFSAAEQQALAVGYPASSPYVTAVGGTQMAPGTFNTGNTTYWGGSTFGFDLVTSLLSYVPEIVWNEGSTSGILAGGGGASAVFNRPSWQSGLAGVPSGATRLVPDIALQSSTQNPGFLLCTDDASFLASEGQTIGCYEGLRGDNNKFTVGGGTSFAAPVFAAMTALLNQEQHSLGQGNVNPTLYSLAANSATGSSVFHDIVSGSIACVPGAPECSAAGQSGFFATAGFDQATGLGSIDYGHLLAAWPASSGTTLAGTLVKIFPQNTTSLPGVTDGLSIYVSPSGGGTAPTGDVTIALDGAIVEPALALSPMQVGDSTASYVLNVPTSPGSHVVVATYPGDATHGPARAAISILVGNVFASGGFTLAAGNVTVPTNGSAETTVTVSPTGGYSGRLFWSLSVTGGGDGVTPSACYFIPTLAVQGVSSTTLSLGAGSACSAALPDARGAYRLLRMQPTTKAGRAGLWPPAAGLLLCWLFPAMRRRRPLPLLCLLLMTAISGLSGCGGGASKAPSSAGTGASSPVTPAVTYTATLTAQDSISGSITSSTSFLLTLQ